MSDSIHIIEVDGEVGEHVTDLRDEITRLRAENERLREALTRIYTWYPISVSEPHKTIRAIQDYAFDAAIEGARMVAQGEQK